MLWLVFCLSVAKIEKSAKADTKTPDCVVETSICKYLYNSNPGNDIFEGVHSQFKFLLTYSSHCSFPRFLPFSPFLLFPGFPVFHFPFSRAETLPSYVWEVQFQNTFRVLCLLCHRCKYYVNNTNSPIANISLDHKKLPPCTMHVLPPRP